jgi:hypothetical protein
VAGALRWIKMQRNELMDNVPPMDRMVMPIEWYSQPSQLNRGDVYGS